MFDDKTRSLSRGGPVFQYTTPHCWLLVDVHRKDGGHDVGFEADARHVQLAASGRAISSRHELPIPESDEDGKAAAIWLPRSALTAGVHPRAGSHQTGGPVRFDRPRDVRYVSQDQRQSHYISDVS